MAENSLEVAQALDIRWQWKLDLTLPLERKRTAPQVIIATNSFVLEVQKQSRTNIAAVWSVEWEPGRIRPHAHVVIAADAPLDKGVVTRAWTLPNGCGPENVKVTPYSSVDQLDYCLKAMRRNPRRLHGEWGFWNLDWFHPDMLPHARRNRATRRHLARASLITVSESLLSSSSICAP